MKLVDDIEPVSVHAWRTPLKKLTALCDARLDLSERSSNPEKMPVILHYVNCGTFWLRTKYEILGAFADSWFGGSLPIAPSFHLDARDVVGTRNAEALEVFYGRHLAPPDADELARQLAAGVLRRLDAPSKLLGGATIAAPVAVAPSIMPPPRRHGLLLRSRPDPLGRGRPPPAARYSATSPPMPWCMLNVTRAGPGARRRQRAQRDAPSAVPPSTSRLLKAQSQPAWAASRPARRVADDVTVADNLVLVPRAVVARVRPPNGGGRRARRAAGRRARPVRIGPARDDLRGPALAGPGSGPHILPVDGQAGRDESVVSLARRNRSRPF